VTPLSPLPLRFRRGILGATTLVFLDVFDYLALLPVTIVERSLDFLFAPAFAVFVEGDYAHG
jgi:hypothetical protein